MADLDNRDTDVRDTEAEASFRERKPYMPYRHAVTFYIAVSIAVVALFALQGHSIHQQCLDGAVNRQAIRDTVLEGLEPLGAKYDEKTGLVLPHGTPIDYYKTHFEERQKALRQAIRTLQRFPAIDCSGEYFNILGGGRG